MKAILVLFDTLNRRMLPSYGCDWVHAPNFRRLEKHTVVFDNCYAGSLPCMPARREINTGRYNFLHRVWGPVEPFDDSMPELLKNNQVYSHLSTDHYHYFEDGGSTYHTRYSSWEFVRGQEADPWKGVVQPPIIPDNRLGRRNYMTERHIRNTSCMDMEREHPCKLTFDSGIDFVRRNAAHDGWFLQIESFDPHEPFVPMKEFEKLYPQAYNGPDFDWPEYERVSQTPDQIEHLRYKYAACVSMCDAQLGRVLDCMDEYDLWKDTMLIVATDHGFLLGEHGWWAKNIPPYYNEVVNNPLYIWDPRSNKRHERRQSLVQTIDFAPTLLNFFGIQIPSDVQGYSLEETIQSDSPVREVGLFGIFGGHVCCTDGRYVYMRAPATPENGPIFNYTLVPMHMAKHFELHELETAELVSPFSFTKQLPVMRVKYFGRPKNIGKIDPHAQGTMLFDLDKDPGQNHPVSDKEVEDMMVRHLVKLMIETDAPLEQFQRLGLEGEFEKVRSEQ